MRNGAIPLWLFPLVFVSYALYFAFTMLRPAYYLTGDQVYYLTMTASLWEDGDLDLADEYADEIYHAFYPQTLTKEDIRGHHLVGQNGELYSRHGAGLPVLILPAWTLGRQVGVNLWLVVLAAVLAAQLFGLMHELVPDRGAVWWGWVGVVLSAPMILYAPLLYTELPAALALTLVLRYGLLRTGTETRPYVALAGVLFLSWLNPRYALLVLPLAAAFWLRGRRCLAVAAAGGIMLPYIHFWVLLGYVPTLRNYGRIALQTLPAGALGLWLDREAGLLPYAPIYLLALYGVLQTRKAQNPAWRWWRWLWLPYFGFISAYDTWFGGWNPPARMMVPLLPVLSPLLALALAAMAPMARRVTAMTLGSAGAVMSGLFLFHPILRYNHLNGRSHLFDFLTTRTGLDLNALWPSLIHPTATLGRHAGLILLGIAAGYGILYTRWPRRAPKHK